ncbi:MAG TPA: fumarylacetoacetate hydrolase family protein [Bryobacteraceae bacterium]|nr:fumarylacetoacetate hydrolase family protein [Bryobacteraceae bacterium]
MPLAYRVETAAKLLAQARIGHQRLAELPPDVRPQSLDEAYDCQDDVIEAWLARYGGEVAGYKVACTNPIAQQQLGVDGPFFGRLLSPFVMESPATVQSHRFFMRVVEAEFAFRIGTDLAPQTTPRTREEIVEAVDGMLPAIEIVDSRYDSWTTVGAVSLIADNACNGAWVRGPLLRDWQGMDLAAQAVKVLVNGELAREGSGAAVLGHPLNALQWLVNKLSSRGIGVRTGQYMTTGVVSEVYMAEPGDHIVADFGPAGKAEVRFSK